MRKNSVVLTVICSILAFIIGACFGLVGFWYFDIIRTEKQSDNFVSGILQIHFPELDSYYTGDCSIIKVGNTEVLIDAGSKIDCVDTLDNYIKTICLDGVLEYVVVTHAHEDHYAGFAYNGASGSLFNRYQIGTIIDFSQTNQKLTTGKGNKTMYANYLDERQEAIDAGAVHYTAKELRTNGNYTFSLSNAVTMTVLDSKYYYEKTSTGENEHSVCTLFSQGDRHFLFTGDLEKKGEESLVALNNLPEVELYKAGHHGSKTSSNDCLLKVIKPKSVCVCCCAGTSEYTDTNANQFPTQEFINRVAPYTDKVYVTSQVDNDSAKTYKSMNGNIVVLSKNTGLEFIFSANDLKLKDTVWFKENRVTPTAWQTTIS